MEERVKILEDKVSKTQVLLLKTLHILEKQTGRDIDEDDKVG